MTASDLLGASALERLARILKRLFRWSIIIVTLVGAYYAYWAPEQGLLIFMMYVVAAMILWGIGRLLQFILVRR